MKIATFNANGIRSSFNKGFKDFIQQLDPDVICIQELKAQPQSLGFDNQNHHIYHIDNTPIKSAQTNFIENYYFWGHYAQKKGYSGVGIFSKTLPDRIIYGIDCENFHLFNLEGRYIQADFAEFSIISSYFPSGSSSNDRVLAKFDFLDTIYPYLINLAQTKQAIICADFNIAHKEIDLKNWKNNLKNPGFLPREREFITNILANGYSDILRQIYPSQEIYTWWSQRGQAYNNNVGWRIDYHLVTTELANRCKDVKIYKEPRLSDHALVLAQFD